MEDGTERVEGGTERMEGGTEATESGEAEEVKEREAREAKEGRDAREVRDREAREARRERRNSRRLSRNSEDGEEEGSTHERCFYASFKIYLNPDSRRSSAVAGEEEEFVGTGEVVRIEKTEEVSDDEITSDEEEKTLSQDNILVDKCAAKQDRAEDTDNEDVEIRITEGSVEELPELCTITPTTVVTLSELLIYNNDDIEIVDDDDDDDGDGPTGPRGGSEAPVERSSRSTVRGGRGGESLPPPGSCSP